MGRFVAALVALALTVPAAVSAQAIDGIWEARLGATVLTFDFDSHLVSFNGTPPMPITPVVGPDPTNIEFDIAVAGGTRRFSGTRTRGGIEGSIAGQKLSLVRLPDGTAHLVGRRRYPMPAAGRDGQAIAKARSMVEELVRRL